VTFVVSVFNQGTTHGRNVEIIDYIPTGLTLADPDWTERSDGSATYAVPGLVAPGQQVDVEIDLTVNADATASMRNLAEIASAEASTSGGVGIVSSDGLPLLDIDSQADTNNSEDPVDDELTNTDNDEDDHDIAVLGISVEREVSGPLAFTGASTGTTVAVAMALMSIGLFLILGSHRRRRRSDQ